MVEIKNVIKSLHLVSGAKNKSNSFFYLFAAPREKAGGGVGGWGNSTRLLRPQSSRAPFLVYD